MNSKGVIKKTTQSTIPGSGTVRWLLSLYIKDDDSLSWRRWRERMQLRGDFGTFSGREMKWPR